MCTERGWLLGKPRRVGDGIIIRTRRHRARGGGGGKEQGRGTMGNGDGADGSQSLWKREQSFWGIIHFRIMSKEKPAGLVGSRRRRGGWSGG